MVKTTLTVAQVDEWVKALRSGDYIQGEERLCKETHDGKLHFCCLGVLAEINSVSREMTLFSTDWQEDVKDYVKFGIYEFLVDGHTFKLRDYIPTNPNNPFFSLDMDTQRELTEMNDNGGKFFPEIADYIEKEIKPHARKE